MALDIQMERPVAARIPVATLGMATGVFLAVTFTLCVGFGLLFPNATMYQSWLPLLPWVSWMSWPDFGLGLVESFAYGWYIAILFAPLYNYFAGRKNG